MPRVYFSYGLLKDHGYQLESVLIWYGIEIYDFCGDIIVKRDYNYNYVQERFDDFVQRYFRVVYDYDGIFKKTYAKNYLGLKTEKFKSLSV